MEGGKRILLQAVSELSRKATPANHRLGRNLFEGGHVRLVESSSDAVVAQVSGSQTRTVEFKFSLGDVSWHCTCRRGQERFCKHAVAAALALQDGERSGLFRR